MATGIEFPKFPSLFTDKDKQRLQELETQRKEIAGIWESTYSPKAWEAFNPVEKTLRNLFGGVMSPITRVLNPNMPEVQYGLTPVQVEKRMRETETEYKELLRRQTVSRTLPLIQDTIRALALTGNPITDASELNAIFQMDEMGYSKEEQEYIVNLARSAMWASPEDLLTGDIFHLQPLTQEDVDKLFRSSGSDVRYVSTSVALSRDLEDVINALRSQYAPKEETSMREQIIRDYSEDLQESALTRDEAKQLFGQLVEQGEDIPITLSTGEMLPGKVKPNNFVYFNDELVGYRTDDGEGNLQIVPLGIGGQPIITPEDQEAEKRNLWEMIYGAFRRAGFSMEAAMTSTIPSAITQEAKRIGDRELINLQNLGLITEEERIRATEQDPYYVQFIRNFNEEAERQLLKKAEWYEKNPQYLPDPRYVGASPIQNPSLLKDPSYFAYMIIESAPAIVTALGVGTAATLVTGSPIIGAISGAAAVTPMMIQDVQEELMAAGLTADQAASLSTAVGSVMGMIEIMPGVTELRTVAAPVFKAFKKEVAKQISKELIGELTKRQLLKGASKQALNIMFQETVEENLQNILQNAAVKTVDSSRGFFDNMVDVTVQTLIATSVLGVAGGGGYYINNKQYLSQDTQNKIDRRTEELMKAGYEADHAIAIALAERMETESGRAEVVQASEEAVLADEELSQETPRYTIEDRQADLTNNDFIDQDIVSYIDGAEYHEVSVATPEGAVVGGIKYVIGDKYVYFGGMVVEGNKYGALVDSLIHMLNQIGNREIITTPLTYEGIGIVENLRKRGIIELEDIPDDFPGVVDEELEQYLIRIKDIPERYQRRGLRLEQPPTTPTEAQQAPAVRQTPYIDQLTRDIQAFERSKATQEQRLQTMKDNAERPDIISNQEELIRDMERTIYDLNASRRRAEQITGTWEQREQTIPSQREVLGDPAIEPSPEEDITSDNLEPIEPLPYVPRPKQQDWEIEQQKVNQALASNPDIADKIVTPKTVLGWLAKTEDYINNLKDRQSALLDAIEDGEDVDADMKAVEQLLSDIAREALLDKEALLLGGWDDIPPDGRRRLMFAIPEIIPNRSLALRRIAEAYDMEYFMEFMEEVTGLPFYSVYRRIEVASGTAENTKERVLKAVTTDPQLKNVVRNKDALTRVAQELNARNEVQGVEHVEGITPEEQLLVDYIQAIYDEYKPKVRYLRFIRTVKEQPTLEALKEEFPDAAENYEAQLENALEVYNTGDMDSLYSYLEPFTWGVIESGFDPRLISAPNLVSRRIHVREKRGKGRLMRRESIEYPEESKMIGNVIVRLSTYIEQMEIQFQTADEIDRIADMWVQVYDKFVENKRVERGIVQWLSRVQGIGMHDQAHKYFRRMFRQAMTAVFINPVLSFRNSLQPILFHPNRTDLIRALVKPLPAELDGQYRYYFDTFVSQLGGLRRDYLHTDQPGFLVPNWWNKLADSLTLYGASDYYPRLLSFKAALLKSAEATEQYRQDGDINAWIKNSGVMHLRHTERNYVMSHYLTQLGQTFDTGATSLREISGENMVNYYIANRISDITHFKYRRATRGIWEMGIFGETVLNLIVFPRGYAQRLYFQSEKIKDTFTNENTTWEEAGSGFRDIMKLAVASLLMDSLFKTVTGRDRNPYFFLEILFGWNFGGLFIGAAQDVTVVIKDLVDAVANPLISEDDKNYAWNRLAQELPNLASTVVPFLKIAIDSLETILDVDGVDRYAVRKVRELFDSTYTPDELEKLDRDLWEKIQHVAMGARTPEPTEIERIQTRLADAEDALRSGTWDGEGRYMTTAAFGSVISEQTRDLPNAMFTEQDRFSPLVLFYKDCEYKWQELYTLPSTPADIRKDWRANHILEEAMLIYWGKYNQSVFTKDSPEGKQISKLLLMWSSRYDTSVVMHKQLSDWTVDSLR